MLGGDTVLAVADVSGIGGLTDGGAAALASVVEGRLRAVIQEAVRIARHARRTKVCKSDMAAAMKLLQISPSLGVPSQAAMVPMRGEATDPSHRVAVVDSVTRFDTLLRQEPPPLPVAPSVSVHWLAVDGVQPDVPGNPAPLAAQGKRQRTAEPGAGAPVEAGVAVKPALSHTLSRELQLYLDKVVQAVRAPKFEVRRRVLQCVAVDRGLQQLMPYMSRFILSEVQSSLRSLSTLNACLQLLRALLQNKYLKLGLYLHQLLPAALTCVVSKHLGESRSEDHWRLRALAASTVQSMLERYGDLYATVRPRIIGEYKRIVEDRDLKKVPLTTLYGAMVGITALGVATFESTLLPVCGHLEKALQGLRAASGVPAGGGVAAAAQTAFEAYMCSDALLSAVGTFLFRRHAPTQKALRDSMLELFGERLMPYLCSHRDSYVTVPFL